MEKLTLTEKNITTLALPEKGKRINYFDTKIPALHVRVSSTGSKSYYIQKRVLGKLKRINLGKCGDLLLRDARDLALETLSDLSRGVDVVNERKKERDRGETFRVYFDLYLKSRSLKASTIKDYNRQLDENLISIADTPIAEIGRKKLLKLFQEKSKSSKARANGAMRVFRAVYNYAIAVTTDDQGVTILPPNPVKILSDAKAWNATKRKKEIIHPDDLGKWVDAVKRLPLGRSEYAESVSRLFLLLIITGWRTNQMINLKWSNVDLNKQIFAISDDDVKNKDGHDLPMSSHAAVLLSEIKAVGIGKGSDFVFAEPGSKKPVDDFRHWIEIVEKESGVKFTLYDLRRSFMTYGSECLDLNMLTVKRLAQHKTQESDVTAGYIVPLVERMRRAAQLISDFILVGRA
ncbi:MAG: tyrosine-type recombinase/integrase [Planctomycetaceae bacterium]|nr:tyrosine-type recombinase/integrase [Planctomycetaceae bacterium]